MTHNTYLKLTKSIKFEQFCDMIVGLCFAYLA